MRRSVAVIVTSGIKIRSFCLDFSFIVDIPKKYLLIEKFENSIQKYCPTTCFSRFIKVTVIRDADKANQYKIAVHLFCIYSSCDRNNMKSLQWQIDFNIINHWGPTPTL